jgi:hypothetical protein
MLMAIKTLLFWIRFAKMRTIRDYIPIGTRSMLDHLLRLHLWAYAAAC